MVEKKEDNKDFNKQNFRQYFEIIKKYCFNIN